TDAGRDAGGRNSGLGRTIVAVASGAGCRGDRRDRGRHVGRAFPPSKESRMTFWQSDSYVYWAIVLLALCSVLTRAGFMVFGDYVPLPDGVRRALRYAPAAALT